MVILISVITCILLILSILVKPNITIKKVSLGTYWLIALAGAIILIALGFISPQEVGKGLIAKTAINPLKILVLFLSMTIQSIFLDEVGLFRYCANVALKKSNGSQLKLFIELYILVSVLTVFTSNDIIILTFTPFICYFSKEAKINPVPFLFAEFVAANTWSMTLIIGNPTNVYLASSNEITFVEYVKTMVLPTLGGGIISFLIMLLLFKKSLHDKLAQSDYVFNIKYKGLLLIGIIHLSICTILLVISSYIGIEMWAITFFFAVSLIIISTIYMKVAKIKDFSLLKCLKRAPWELVPFLISMFVFVLTFDKAGVSEKICSMLGENNTILKYGFVSFFTANLINNIPMSVLFCSIVKFLEAEKVLSAVFASIVGSNIGAFLTPIGALAGIMWLNIVKKNNVKFSFAEFVKYGFIVSIPTLFVTLVVLAGVLK